MKTEVDRFHDHLDECKQCMEQPFNLCATGEVLLKGLENVICPGCNQVIPKCRCGANEGVSLLSRVVLTMGMVEAAVEAMPSLRDRLPPRPDLLRDHLNLCVVCTPTDFCPTGVGLLESRIADSLSRAIAKGIEEDLVSGKGNDNEEAR